jgi:hypothetical protein
MAVSKGRFLEEHEHVDHIDEDKSNDILENLQILTQQENNRKAVPQQVLIVLTCPCCGVTFTREKRQTHNRKSMSCSRSCASKYQHNKC